MFPWNFYILGVYTGCIRLPVKFYAVKCYFRIWLIIYDLTDLMRILKVSRRTLFTWISEGILPTKMLGKKHYISKRELMALIESNPALQKGGRHE